MVSLVSIILNLLGKNTLIKVRRFPPTKVLRAHLLGLTLGLVFALLAIVLDYKPLFSDLEWYVAPAFILLFVFGTRFGGIFVLFLVILLSFFSGSTGTLGTLLLLAEWYIWGYVAGAIFSILYNDLIFLYFLTFGKDQVKISFVFDPGKKLNIIKSPIFDEEPAILNGELKDQKLYDYAFDHSPGSINCNCTKHLKPPKHPFTIAFVANPKIFLRKRKPDDKPDHYIIDPIMYNMRLFLRSIDDALAAFESNEVLGRPEIWSRVRVIALFDRDLADQSMSGEKVGLVQPTQNLRLFDGEVAENILDPMEQMVENYKAMVRGVRSQSGLSDTKIEQIIRETDAIFALSAVLEYNRSSAHHTDWVESIKEDPKSGRPGKEFIYDPDPCGMKGTDITSATCADDDRFTCIHEYYAEFPGRVALNVLSATRKTWVHEFGHAMSNAFHGAIVDEYYDTSQLNADDGNKDNCDCKNNETDTEDEIKTPFYANRIERKRNDDGTIVPVHKTFAKYECTDFTSDMDHPSSEEHWIGYFPDRKSLRFTCTMDRTYGDHRFDELISNFMYDRLITKINRPDHPDAKGV